MIIENPTPRNLATKIFSLSTLHGRTARVQLIAYRGELTSGILEGNARKGDETAGSLLTKANNLRASVSRWLRESNPTHVTVDVIRETV